jgi:RNA polymerase sigma factor (sigma-70 family)
LATGAIFVLPDEPGPAAGAEVIRSTLGGLVDQPAMMTGVRSSFLDLFDSEYHQVIRFLMHCGASFEQAEEAAQEAFSQAWQHITRNPARWVAVRNPRAWIRTVALRKYQRPPGARACPAALLFAQGPETAQPGPGHDELTVEAMLVQDMLRGLGPRERAVMAYSLDGFKAHEIASELGLTPQQVRDARKKARKILAARLAVPGSKSGGQSHVH